MASVLKQKLSIFSNCRSKSRLKLADEHKHSNDLSNEIQFAFLKVLWFIKRKVEGLNTADIVANIIRFNDNELLYWHFICSLMQTNRGKWGLPQHPPHPESIACNGCHQRSHLAVRFQPAAASSRSHNMLIYSCCCCRAIWTITTSQH